MYKIFIFVIECSTIANINGQLFKAIFSMFRFFAPPDSRFSLPNIVLSKQTIHRWKAYLFSFQMKCTSQKKKKKKNGPMLLLLWSRVTTM